MNAKYVVALILALQVSVSLCEIPAPSQELLDKYNGLKAIFYKRIQNAAEKLQGLAAPMMEQAGNSEQAGAVKEYVDELQAKPEFQNLVKFMTGLGGEVLPLVDQARLTALGFYEQNLRAKIGPHLEDAINNIKPVLDKYLPSE